MEFIHDQSIVSEVRALLRKGDGDAYLVVAFWGKGAVEALDLKALKRKIYVVCNFELGGTNPHVIKTLQSLPNVHVKHTRKLHAKVYWNGRGCIVGSANVSSNGLGWEGSETKQLIEAAIKFDDKGQLTKVGGWLRKVWKDSQIVTKADLKKAAAIWLKRRNERPPSYAPKSGTGTVTLKDLLREDRNALDDRKIYARWWFPTTASKQAKKAAKKKQEAEPLFAKWYEFEEHFKDRRLTPLPLGGYIIDASAPEDISRPAIKQWTLDKSIWFMNDWLKNPEYQTKLSGKRALYWLRPFSHIPAAATDGKSISFNTNDRQLLREIVAAHADKHLTRTDMLIRLGDLLEWAERQPALRQKFKTYLAR
jgi:hypothetical protein